MRAVCVRVAVVTILDNATLALQERARTCYKAMHIFLVVNVERLQACVTLAPCLRVIVTGIWPTLDSFTFDLIF